jgi:phosphate:Na+ symporter
MKAMSDLFAPMQSYLPFVDSMKRLNNPFFAIIMGFLFTLIVRSSGVTSGIVIALALANAIDLYQAIPVILGSQIGTCFTALFVSLGRSRDSKRTALFHVFHQTAGVLIILPFHTLIYYKGEPVWKNFVRWFTRNIAQTDDLARQIAMSHTLAALLNLVIFLPLLPVIYKVFSGIFPSKEEEKPFGPIYIDDDFLETPSIALEQAKKEIVREGEIVLDMLKKSIKVCENQDLGLCETIVLKEIHADKLRNVIVPYLTKLGQDDLTEEQSVYATKLLFAADDIESIGDVLDKNIVPLLKKKLENKLWFSEEGWKDIVSLHVMVTDNYKKVLDALRKDDMDQTRLVIEKKSEINNFVTELRKKHIERLTSGVRESLETSSLHIDFVDQIRSINSHVNAICYALLGRV